MAQPHDFLSKETDLSVRLRGGFALVATISLMILLALVAVAMLSLATIEIKHSRQSVHTAEAEANARLALMMAIGELQRELGPDQRVSAPAAVLAAPESSDESPSIRHPHWVGVWSSRGDGDSPIWVRNDLEGGLRDQREQQGWSAESKHRNYLVSGNEGGIRRSSRLKFLPDNTVSDREENESIHLVSTGSVGSRSESEVIVPKVPLTKDTRVTGNYAYWVGDLGVRANIKSSNPHEGAGGSGAQTSWPLLAAADAETSAIQVDGASGGLDLSEEEKARMVTTATLALAGGRPEWSQSLFHDLTVQSQGVLADVREGGLKKNLTAFFEENGDIPDLKGRGKTLSRGLNATDNLVGPSNPEAAESQGIRWEQTRHRKTSPKFALLRDWARYSKQVTLNAAQLEMELPAAEDEPRIPSFAQDEGFQNLNPSAIASFDETSLTPILVEASMYNTLSTHPNPTGSAFRNNIRGHLYPRVVLWNPYNVPIVVDRSMALMQVNGRRGFRTDAWLETPTGLEFLGFSSWLAWGGRTNDGIVPTGQITSSDMYNDPYTGSYYFVIPETEMQPGDCLVFTSEKAAEYDTESLENNTLSCTVTPSPKNNYYQSSSEYGGGMNWYPRKFWYAPSDAWFGGNRDRQETQGDDSQMILKSLKDVSSGIRPEDFDHLPQIAAVSCSMQYGGGKEPVEAWAHTEENGVTIERTPLENPVLRLPPDVRTRQGYRMRWFREHQSHLNIEGNELKGSPFWEESFFGNWNLRAAYATRSPWENIAGNVGDGIASGPWFFGIYTRDLYDHSSVGWRAQLPRRGSDGRQRGNPFGLPTEGEERYVLFDLPRTGVGVMSLAQLQHAKVSEFIWHPSYAIGNSLVDPRLGSDQQNATTPEFLSADDRGKGGFSEKSIGWSTNGDRSKDPDAWARVGRGLFQDYPSEDHLVYDLSFELNHTLWDRYFLTSGNQQQIRRFAAQPDKDPLPNARMKLWKEAPDNELLDFHKAAAHLMVDGAFNVNSTSVEAWKAILSANRRDDEYTPFPRVLNALGDEWSKGNSLNGDKVWAGTRLLTDGEISNLAQAIVKQVKLRGPFLSLSDFVNRRLANDATGKAGPLEAAIQESGINEAFDTDGDFTLDNTESLKETYAHPDHIEDPTRIEQTLKPPSKAWGAPVYLTQADLLQTIGPMLTARSDTFVIRAYGESVVQGQVKARAWCEATVQRIPEPLKPDATGLNPLIKKDIVNFGRRFKVTSFRWLNPSEV